MADKKNHFSSFFKLDDLPNSSNNLSPMTDLAMNLGSLTTITHTHIETPKRRISWSCIDKLTPVKEKTSENDISRWHEDSLENRFLTDISNESNKISRTRTGYHSIKSQSSFKSDMLFDSPLKENLPVSPESSSTKNENDESEKAQIVPSYFTTLLKKPLVSMDEDDIDSAQSMINAKSCIRGLFRRSSEPLTLKQACKRLELSPSSTPTLQIAKRRKAVSVSTCTSAEMEPPMPMKIGRSYSETEAINIMRAVQLSAENPDLIGDFSRPYSLPLIQSEHGDLKSISSETLSRLLHGDFKSSVSHHIVVDCRFPYEFEGGHIQGAKNIFSEDNLLEEFFNESKLNSLSGHCVIIFHCEFSSKRGPTLSRFMRKKDREFNEGRYPSLHYPEVYLLNGGYKAFFNDFKALCEPQSYKSMTHEGHEKELKFFRAKTKSFSSDHKRKISIRPGLKF